MRRSSKPGSSSHQPAISLLSPTLERNGHDIEKEKKELMKKRVELDLLEVTDLPPHKFHSYYFQIKIGHQFHWSSLEKSAFDSNNTSWRSENGAMKGSRKRAASKGQELETSSKKKKKDLSEMRSFVFPISGMDERLIQLNVELYTQGNLLPGGRSLFCEGSYHLASIVEEAATEITVDLYPKSEKKGLSSKKEKKHLSPISQLKLRITLFGFGKKVLTGHDSPLLSSVRSMRLKKLQGSDFLTELISSGVGEKKPVLFSTTREKDTLQRLESARRTSMEIVVCHLRDQVLGNKPKRPMREIELTYFMVLLSILSPISFPAEKQEHAKIFQAMTKHLPQLQRQFGISSERHNELAQEANENKSFVIGFLKRRKDNLEKLQSTFKSKAEYDKWETQQKVEIQELIDSSKGLGAFRASIEHKWVYFTLMSAQLESTCALPESREKALHYADVTIREGNGKRKLTVDTPKLESSRPEWNADWLWRVPEDLHDLQGSLEISIRQPVALSDRVIGSVTLQIPSDIMAHVQHGLAIHGREKISKKSDVEFGFGFIERTMASNLVPEEVLKKFQKDDPTNIAICLFQASLHNPKHPLHWVFEDIMHRLGLRAITAKLTLLEALTQPLSVATEDQDNIITIVEELTKLHADIPDEWTTEEESMFRLIKANLRTQIQRFYTNFNRTIEIITAQQFEKLWDLTWSLRRSDVTKAEWDPEKCTFERFVYKSSRERAREDIKSFIHTGIQHAYKDLKSVSPDDGVARIYVAVPEMRKTVNEVEQHVSAWRHSGINPVSIAVKEFNYMLMNDLPLVLAQPGSAWQKLELYPIVQDIVKFFLSKEAKLQEQALPVDFFFVDILKNWLTEQHNELCAKADASILTEDWKPAEASVVYSSLSVRALFTSVWGLIEEIVKFPSLGLYKNLNSYAKTVRTVVLKYVVAIQKEFVNEFQNSPPTEWKDVTQCKGPSQNIFPQYLSITITPKLCVIMSNLDVAQKMLMAVEGEFQKHLSEEDTNRIKEEVFKNAYQVIAAEKKAQTKAIQNAFARDLAFCAKYYAQPDLSSEDRDGTFFSYLQYQVDKLHESLDPVRMFDPLLESIFLSTIEQLIQMTKPEFFQNFDSKLTSLDRGSLLVELTEHVNNFFDAGGEGLVERVRNKHLSHIRMLLQFYVSKTEMIVEVIKGGERTLAELGVELDELLDVLQSRPEDKEAWDFAKTYRPNSKRPGSSIGKVASWFGL